MPADLTLTGAIPTLLRRGSPLVGPYGGGAVYIEAADCDEVRVVLAADDGVESIPCSAVTLDLTDPTGRYHALLWLRERGHDLRWAEDEAEVLAWSVLSVARGGDVIRAIDDVPRFVNTRCSLAQFAGASFWWTATAEDRDFFVGPDGKHHGWYYAGMFGPETGDDAIRIVCGHALADRCALRNEDGTLTLPPLPEVPRV